MVPLGSAVLQFYDEKGKPTWMEPPAMAFPGGQLQMKD
jgi:hypothetical protein